MLLISLKIDLNQLIIMPIIYLKTFVYNIIYNEKGVSFLEQKNNFGEVNL